MLPILTITLNPALDLAVGAETVVPGPKLRCTAPRVDPGGGGINISRAIRSLGGDSRAFVAVGGAVGARLTAILQAEGVEIDPFAAPGETRESLTVTEAMSGAQYRFVMPGAAWPAGLADQALAQIDALVPQGGLVVLSGSFPPGIPDDFPSRLAERVGQRASLVVDTSGTALQHLSDAQHPGIALLRMDGEEAARLAGRALPNRHEAAAFAADLVARGVAGRVVVAMGPEGSVLAEPGARLFCPAPKVAVKSKVGAGDSYVAGHVLALARGGGSATALALGVAAASATVMTEATELCHAPDVEALLPRCVIVPLPD